MAKSDASPFTSKRWQASAVILCGGWLLLQPSWSDRVSGILLLVFSLLSLKFHTVWLQWLQGVVGVWLLAAPLVFWTPSLFSYANDTLVGTLVLLFALVIPYTRPTGGSVYPLGWSYNPSAWKQRLPIVVIGFFAFAVAAYMASFQLGHFGQVWDPFFGDGTRQVLQSDVSKAFPVSDAGLGALTYLIEALSGLMGDVRRWRTMPWVVILFGFLVVPAGVVSIVLVVLQPWAVGVWCALCLLSAVLCLATIPPAIDEIVATGQFLLEARREGTPLWRALFIGEVEPLDVQYSRQSVSTDSWFDLRMPWNLAAAGVLGFWVMASPAAWNYSGGYANCHYLTGALIITFSVMAMAEAGRAFRFVNFLFGAWMLLLPWIFGPVESQAMWSDVLAGLGVIALSFRRGPVREHYGTWDPYVV